MVCERGSGKDEGKGGPGDRRPQEEGGRDQVRMGRSSLLCVLLGTETRAVLKQGRLSHSQLKSVVAINVLTRQGLQGVLSAE